MKHWPWVQIIYPRRVLSTRFHQKPTVVIVTYSGHNYMDDAIRLISNIVRKEPAVSHHFEVAVQLAETAPRLATAGSINHPCLAQVGIDVAYCTWAPRYLGTYVP